MRRTRTQTQREPTTALINIVFLILIFFMVAGSLAAPPANAPDFVESDAPDCCIPPDALFVAADGEMSYQGKPIASAGDYLGELSGDTPGARLLPDKELPAQDLLKLVSALCNAGAERVILMTEHTES